MMSDYTSHPGIQCIVRASLVWAMPSCRPTDRDERCFVAFEGCINFSNTGTDRVDTDKKRFCNFCVRHPTEQAIKDLQTAYVEWGRVARMDVM